MNRSLSLDFLQSVHDSESGHRAPSLAASDEGRERIGYGYTFDHQSSCLNQSDPPNRRRQDLLDDSHFHQPGPTRLDDPRSSQEPKFMAASLLCRLGRHDWKRKRNDEGRPYRECTRCGKCEDPRAGGPPWADVGLANRTDRG